MLVLTLVCTPLPVLSHEHFLDLLIRHFGMTLLFVIPPRFDIVPASLAEDGRRLVPPNVGQPLAGSNLVGRKIILKGATLDVSRANLACPAHLLVAQALDFLCRPHPNRDVSNPFETATCSVLVSRNVSDVMLQGTSPISCSSFTMALLSFTQYLL